MRTPWTNFKVTDSKVKVDNRAVGKKILNQSLYFAPKNI